MQNLMQRLLASLILMLCLGLTACACIAGPGGLLHKADEATDPVIQRAVETRLAYYHPQSGQLIWADDNVQYIT